MFELIALDLDGTIVRRDNTIGPEDLAALEDARELGAKIVIATGRRYASSLDHAHTLHTELPIICYTGAQVVDYRTGQILRDITVPEHVAASLAHFSDDNPQVNLIAYANDVVHVLRTHYDASMATSFWPNRDLRVVGSLADLVEQGLDFSQFITVGEDSANKVLENYETNGDCTIHKCGSGSKRTLHIVGPGATKAGALSWLAERHGIAREKIIAFGDSENDLDMLRWAGLGVAMGNSHPEAVRAADIETAPVDEAGVAQVIRKYFMEDAV